MKKKKIKKNIKPRLSTGTLLADKEYPEEIGMVVDIDKDKGPDPYRVYVLGYNEYCHWLDKRYIEEGCNVLRAQERE